MPFAALAIAIGSLAQADPAPAPTSRPEGVVQDEAMRQGGASDTLREQASPPPNEGPGPF